MADAGPGPLPLCPVARGELRQILMELAPSRASKTRSRRDEDDPGVGALPEVGNFLPEGAERIGSSCRMRTA